MSGWETFKTQRLISDTVLEIGDGYRAKNSEMAHKGIPFIRAGDVNGRVNAVGTDLLSFESVEKVGRKRSMPGDVVITTKGTIGRMAIVLEDDPVFIYSPQLCYWRSLDHEKLSPRWLFFALQSNEMMEQMSWSAGQTDMAPYISLTDQRTAFSISLPEIEEQREIAAILGALDDKIELNRKTAATLEEMARALYRSWFVDFDPVHAKAAGRPPAHMDEATAALFPDKFGEDGLPEGWEFEELGNYCTQGKQTVQPMQKVDQFFQHFSLPAFDTGQEAPVELGSEIKSNKVFVSEDAILFSRLNPRIPRVWWAKTSPERATPVCSTEFFVAEAATKDSVPHLYCLLSSGTFLEAALSRVGGTSGSHQRVSPDGLKTIPIIMPVAEVVEAFGEIAQAWFDKIHLIIKENQTLAVLRDTLLPRLMSGELRVGEAREQVENVA